MTEAHVCEQLAQPNGAFTQTLVWDGLCCAANLMCERLH